MVTLSKAPARASNGRSPPRVLIVSDVRLYREGLAAALAGCQRVEVVGGMAGPDLTVASLSQLHPDVILLDVALPGCLGMPTALSLGHPAKFVAFAVSEGDEDILACAEAGISGYVGKDGSTKDVVAAIESVVRGELQCPPRLAATLFARLATLARSQARRPGALGLTDRELEIVGLVDQGHPNKEIARRLGIGAATVKNHVHNILEKLNVERRAEAAAMVRGIGARLRPNGL